MSVCVLGSINRDLVLRVRDLPKPGETVLARGFKQYPGGKGANQAVASARLGAPTRLLGAVGPDDAGVWMRAELAAAGVDLGALVQIEGQDTGQAHILVSDHGENAIVVVSGANQALDPQHLDLAAVAGARVLIAQLETPVATVAAFFASAARPGPIRILNAAPASLAARDLFALADILVVNETELAHYAQTATISTDPQAVAAIARRLISRPDQWVVTTLGAAGVVAARADQSLAVPGRSLPVRDTTGAGDCFCGALAARLSQGAGLEQALIFANAAAGLSVGRDGAARSMPTRPEVEALLAADAGAI